MDASNPSSSSAGLARPAWNKGKFTARSRHCGWGMCGPFEPGCNWTPFARLGPVQSRDRQQAAWLRPCRGPRRRCGSQRLRNRSGHRPSEKDRPASSFRVNRGNQAGGGRLPSSKRFDAGPIPLPRALRPSSAFDDAAVCATSVSVGLEHWPRPAEVRHAFDAPDQGNIDLSPHRQPACGATFAGAPKN
jgi:hypothetical protein